MLAEDLAAPPVAEPTLRRHVVLVLVDRLDMATARALQLASSLTSSGDVRAVHFAVEPEHAARIAKYWRKPGLSYIPLEIVECPDRRIVRGATELAAEHAADGETEVTLVLPRRVHRGMASRLLHDRTSDRIVSAVNQLPHVSATIAPFDVAGMLKQRSTAGALESAADMPRRSLKRVGRRPVAEPRRLINLEERRHSASSPTGSGRSSPAECTPCACNRGSGCRRSNARSSTTPAPSRPCSSADARSRGSNRVP